MAIPPLLHSNSIGLGELTALDHLLQFLHAFLLHTADVFSCQTMPLVDGRDHLARGLSVHKTLVRHDERFSQVLESEIAETTRSDRQYKPYLICRSQ